MRLFAVLILSLLSAAPKQWNDTTRDVYVDGKLDRNVQTLATADGPRMIAVVCGDEVLILDPASKAVTRTTRENFSFNADRTAATTNAELAPLPAGDVTKIEPSTYLVRSGDRTIVVTTHQSKAGPMTVEELWTTVPVWRSIAEAYEPDAAMVEELRAVTEPTRLQVVLATWCGDSKKHVPRLLKAVEKANNPNIKIEILGVGPDFESPMREIQAASVTNVPTVIVQRGERELGRYVETPAGATIEADVVDILHARQRPHPGAIKRGAKLAEGAYLLRDAKRREEGREQFELYERPGGGTIAHSTIAKRDGSKIETWASFDAERKPRSCEVTVRANGTSTRTRYRYDNGEWYATSRGATGGIVTQVMAVPPDWSLIAPATVTYGWAKGATYVVDEGVGALRDLRFELQMRGDVPAFVRFKDGSDRRLVTLQ